MKKGALLLTLFLLVSCGGNANPSTSQVISPITTISPTGAPTLCFYDKGNDSNYYFTYDSTQVKAQITTNHEYDALVMDATTALKLIKANNSPYKFAQLLTGGNTFLVSINKTDGYGFPKAGDKVVGFQENLIPGIIYKKLAKDYWKLDDGVQNIWLDNVSNVAPILKTGMYAGEPVDFVYIAEPAMTAAIEGVSGRQIISNVRVDWKDYSKMDCFPQAALFVKESSYKEKTNLFESYLSDLDSRLKNILSNIDGVIDTLYDFGTKEQITSRFGFSPEAVRKTQKTNNGLGIASPTLIYGHDEINAFLKFIGDSSSYDESYFLTRIL